jgi:hypothetical protein
VSMAHRNRVMSSAGRASDEIAADIGLGLGRMSAVGYTFVVHIALYGTAAFVVNIALRRSVVQRRMAAVTACVSYVAVLALLPSFLMLAVGRLANYLFTSGLVAPEPAWDVGLAMSLFVSTWVCYAVGLLAACLGSWSFFKSSPDARAT